MSAIARQPMEAASLGKRSTAELKSVTFRSLSPNSLTRKLILQLPETLSEEQAVAKLEVLIPILYQEIGHR